MITEKEKLLKETYDRFVQTSLNVLPLAGIEDNVDQNIMGCGTTIDEKILSISGYRELIERQQEHGKDIKVNFERNPVSKRLLNDGNAAVIIEEIDLLLSINGESLRIHLRLTTVWEYLKNKWIAVHWHSSKPEYEEGGTDTWHINEFKQKNQQLEKLVAEKTADLELKNRELEIETALERVRAVAMGMNKYDDLLNICKASFSELINLGFENLRNVVIHIPYDEQKYFMDYDFSDFTGGQIGKVEYGLHPIVDEYLEKIKSAEDAFFKIVIDGDMLDSWNDFRRKSGQMNDQRLDEADALYYYLFSIGIGDIGISTFKPINKSQIKTLKRFRNVFDLAYKRYMDISKAEAQAREAKIEAALEKVRAKAMGMHKSEEVGSVSDILFAELNKLDFDIRGCSIVVIDKLEDKMELWRARSTVSIKPFESTSLAKAMNIVKKYLPDFFPKFLNAVGTRKGQLIEEFSGKRRLQFINAVTEQYTYSNSEKSVLEKNTPDTITTHFIFFKLGYLVLLSERKLSDDDLSIAKRFIEVFSFAYSRFLDIKKAEAQAREAEIQLALERVRARTMAMQHSDELAETSFLLAQQVRELGIDAWGCAFHIYADNDEGDYEWFSNKDGYLPFYKTPRKNFFKRFYEKRQSGETLYVEEFKGKVCEKHYDFLLSLPVVGDALRELRDSGIPLPTSQIDHIAYFKHGYLLFVTYEHIPEAYDIFKRFAKEFEQTYTRFLDLQKSEAQAREAQIEAALERVRTTAMAMHKSEDLSSSVALVFSELDRLGFKTVRCGIGIFNDNSRKVNVWAASSDDKANTALLAGDEVLEGHPLLEKIYDGWQNQYDFSYTLTGKELIDYYKYTITSNLPVEGPELLSEQLTQYFHCVMFPAGGLFAFRDKAFSDEALKLMKRFADVFHLAFTRHLDLKQAEEQNKIIQAENERKSQELEEARQLQLSMLPKELPDCPTLDIAVYMSTSTEVGGDYYDFNVNSNGALTAVIGDATGHGLKAGMMVTATKSLFESLAAAMEQAGFLRRANRTIKQMHLGTLKMALTMIRIDDRMVTLSSAGMPPLLVYHTARQELEEINCEGMPLGSLDKFPYQSKKLTLFRGDKIILMSDGFPERQNPDGAMLDYPAAYQTIFESSDKSPQELVEHLVQKGDEWAAGRPQDDDVTFVVIEVKN